MRFINAVASACQRPLSTPTDFLSLGRPVPSVTKVTRALNHRLNVSLRGIEDTYKGAFDAQLKGKRII